MKRTSIYLDEEQIELLDRLARSQGLSRAETVRRLLDGVLRNEVDDVATGLAAIGESFGILAGTEWPERGAADRDTHLARIGKIGSI